MEHGSLPVGVALVRTTDEFDVRTVPPGLLRAHHLAAGVHGCLRVLEGSVRFVWEAGGSTDGDDVEEEGELPDGAVGAEVVELEAGDSLIIPPLVRHHVEPSVEARFVVEFHR